MEETTNSKSLIGLCWIPHNKIFCNDHNGEVISNLVPIGESTMIRRDPGRLAADIKKKAPKSAEAYCIGYDHDNVFARDGIQIMVPIQYFSLSKRKD